MQQQKGVMQRELREAVYGLLDSLPLLEPVIPNEIEGTIAALSEFVARSRTHVDRNPYGRREIISVADSEAPTRLAQQLAQLSRGSALIGDRKAVGEEDLALVQRVALDCMPNTRRRLLSYATAKAKAALSKKVLLRSPPQIPGSSRQYALEDLEALGILSRDSTLTDQITGLLRRAGLL